MGRGVASASSGQVTEPMMGEEEERISLLRPGRPSMDRYRCGGELKLVHRHRLQQIPY